MPQQYHRERMNIMKTFVISAVIATMAATSSFAAVGDTVSNGYGKTLEVVSQSTGSSGHTTVILENDRGQDRKFIVRKNGKVRGKGGKKLKANIAAMVVGDMRTAIDAEIAAERAQSKRERSANTHNLAYCPSNTPKAGTFYDQPVNAGWSFVYEMCGEPTN